ncbi:MAG: hypothetical protein EOP09_17385 [Proteobacteria bacterium]|nr:MAG: hypothetical protein EOP09_17385 [Pseudomonadota bacterium]
MTLSLFRGFSMLSTTFCLFNAVAAHAAPVEKEWTLLVYMNGFNSLDDFTTADLNEMEKIGSTDQTSIVVQWASLQTKAVKRVYVTKDQDPDQVTSPVVQNLGQTDMGDYRNLVEFVRWAHENYPAKHYFIDVWNHGSGWHRSRCQPGRRSVRPPGCSRRPSHRAA